MKIDSIVIPEENPELYDSLFQAAELYLVELAKREADRDLRGITELLLSIDTTTFETEASMLLYNRLREDIFPLVAEQYYDEGHDLYGDGKYEEALELLLKAYTVDPTDVNAIYFIGRSYHRLRDYDKATLYYTLITTDFADSNRNREALARLSEIPAQE